METEDAVLHITDIQHATNGVNDGEATQANILLLPAELRIRIYEFCLVSTDVIDLADRAQRREPGVLAACRQIRFEALAIFYSENNFTATERDTESPSSDWARQIASRSTLWPLQMEYPIGGTGVLGFRVSARGNGRGLARKLLGAGVLGESIKAVVVQSDQTNTDMVRERWCRGLADELATALML
ncbi:hypothetical protein LTR56_007554 [Elasticomyces elasticus]|nr:hypothetical protein LTR56_007554 [Elasticomyces elasticus]KAK4929772.1 hypothetical protein LTR49_003730 [Elasticomyces elasticus]KAK5756973.1 hypothetical protein LTS12_012923 [Elasticomyces elasticus]